MIPNHQAEPHFHRIAVIINAATRGNPAKIAQLIQERTPPGVEVDIRVTTAAGTATGLALKAIQRDNELVVAAGGDGTLAEVVTAVHGTGIPCGVLPIGTTNNVARHLRIPRNPEKAWDLLMGSNRLINMDVGQLAGRKFIHMAGAGIDGLMFQDTNLQLKRRLGWPAYVPAVARHLRQSSSAFHIETDDFSIDLNSALVLVANGRSILEPLLPLHSDIRSDDGWLDVVAFTPEGLTEVARTFGRLVIRRPDRSPFIQRFRVKRVSLSAFPPVPVQIDGDVVGLTPVSMNLEVLPVQIVVPLARSAPTLRRIAPNVEPRRPEGRSDQG